MFSVDPVVARVLEALAPDFPSVAHAVRLEIERGLLSETGQVSRQWSPQEQFLIIEHYVQDLISTPFQAAVVLPDMLKEHYGITRAFSVMPRLSREEDKFEIFPPTPSDHARLNNFIETLRDYMQALREFLFEGGTDPDPDPEPDPDPDPDPDLGSGSGSGGGAIPVYNIRSDLVRDQPDAEPENNVGDSLEDDPEDSPDNGYDNSSDGGLNIKF